MRLPQTLLFSVLLWIAAVQSQTVVLSPAVLSVSRGQSATFSCNVGVKDGDATFFLSQIPGEAPKLLLYHHHSYSAPKYGPGISSAHFSASVNSAGTEYQFLIKNAEVTDTALYYCLKWYNSPPGFVFSQSSKLIVTVDSFPKPSVLLFPPPSQELAADKTFTCHMSKLSVSLAKVRWTVDGTSTDTGVQTGLPSRDSDSSFSLSSYLTVPASSMSPNKVYACSIQQEGSVTITSEGLRLSECAQ
ncbi:immunoglobulin kappa light chain-like isoform X3 [Rhinatrema bivittatum]|uniref:immunoglobulin kappa light chain-like isoform X3 n=1 Tax=Rhinatrema bivittatum TaxID=194408 RepID=UPI0011293549|nr:immunoglobulin kappa light chain-like isoform X3 [Rhinatrema bivittatum]